MAKVVGNLIETEDLNNVLIIEDEDDFYQILDLTIKTSGAINTVVDRARNLAELDEAIRLGIHKYKMIIFDGILKCHSPYAENTVAKIREIRQDLGYMGIMVAASSNDDILEKQVQSGCDFAVKKYDIPKVIMNLTLGTCHKVNRAIDNTFSI